jgi:hypothetical protein
MQVKIVAHRDTGFDAPIYVQFPFQPPGVGTNPQMEIPKGASEVLYPLNANGGAQVGIWPVYAIGWSDVGGPVWVSTQLAELEIATPLVTVETARVSCEQGQGASFFCKIIKNREFDGQATIEILGVPQNIKVAGPLTFSSETSELIIPIETTDQSPIGQHRGLFCRVTIPQNGEYVVSHTGGTELQINPPSKIVAAGQPADQPAAATPAPAAAQPKSRLQQLRESAHHGKGVTDK